MENLLNLEPTSISRDLKGKFLLVYGEAKVGKTTFAAHFPKPLLFAFEHGYNAISGIHAIDIFSWSDFKRYARQLKDEAIKEKFSTIIIDTIGIAVDLCEKYILAQNGVDQLSDIAWGGGWAQYRKEFENTFRELSQLGYAIVFIAHSKVKPSGFKNSKGEEIDSYYPDVNKTGFNAVNRLVDIIGYLSVEFQADGSSKRWLYSRQTPYIFAGTRYRYMAPKIPFGYNELVDAISDAIEKEQQEGAQVVDSMAPIIIPRPFGEAQAEAKELWTKLTSNNNEANTLIIQESIMRIFGQRLKLSQVTENQLELLELVIDDMKKMV